MYGFESIAIFGTTCRGYHWSYHLKIVTHCFWQCKAESVPRKLSNFIFDGLYDLLNPRKDERIQVVNSKRHGKS